MAEECLCHVRGDFEIVYCPLHEAAPELLQALKPFAALDVEAFDHYRGKPGEWVVYQMNERVITVGQFRIAREAIRKAEGNG